MRIKREDAQILCCNTADSRTVGKAVSSLGGATRHAQATVRAGREESELQEVHPRVKHKNQENKTVPFYLTVPI